MKKLFKSFKYAFKGIAFTYRTQLNFRVHVAISFLAILAGFYLQLNTSEWLWICLAIALVLVLELLNTAIEVLVDIFSPNFRPRAGIVKDVAAAAVLMAAVLAVLIGLFIFGPKVF
ncbi:MAG TPA: diacylglycerol kinase family protein [Daejeonella sp.]|nr:diacylglycerol kinase family protein [Daejeonella sp.]